MKSSGLDRRHLGVTPYKRVNGAPVRGWGGGGDLAQIKGRGLHKNRRKDKASKKNGGKPPTEGKPEYGKNGKKKQHVVQTQH